jgi:hypothetical protein
MQKITAFGARLKFFVGWGRVLEIVDFYQNMVGEPAPTRIAVDRLDMILNLK